jgi:dihydropteroate synthase
VAQESLEVGAQIINDISGGEIDPSILSVVSNFKCPYVLMHSKGTPQTMQNHATYTSIFKEVVTYFSQKLHQLQLAGVHDVLLDPGFGFAKTLEQNYALFDHIADFHFLGRPMLIGVSRKSMIYKKLEVTPEESLIGTTVLHTKALFAGAKILRVHDTKEAKQILKIMNY